MIRIYETILLRPGYLIEVKVSHSGEMAIDISLLFKRNLDNDSGFVGIYVRQLYGRLTKEYLDELVDLVIEEETL